MSKAALPAFVPFLLLAGLSVHAGHHERVDYDGDASRYPHPPRVTTPPMEVTDQTESREAESAPAAAPKEDDPTLMERIDSFQETVADRVVRISRGVDWFLGGEGLLDDEEYDSVLRIETRYVHDPEDGGFSTLIGGSIHLPEFDDRLQIVFEDEDADDPAARDRERGARSPDDGTRQQVGLDWLYPLRDWSLSTGARLGSGERHLLDFRYRARLSRDFRPGRWRFRPRGTVFTSERTGGGHTVDFRIDRWLGADDRFRLRSETGATWFRREEQYYFDQTFQLRHRLSPKRDLRWEIGADAVSDPENTVTLYYAQIRLRSVVHRDWMVAEIRPQWIRERDELDANNGNDDVWSDDFSSRFRLVLGIDILFGGPAVYGP